MSNANTVVVALVTLTLAFALPTNAHDGNDIGLFGLDIIDEDPEDCSTFAVRLGDVLEDDDQLEEEHIVFDILIAGAPSYIALHGEDDWDDAAAAEMAPVDVIYRDNFDMSINIVGYAPIPEGAINYAADGTVILDDLSDYFQANDATYPHADRDAVLLLIGEDVSGATIGQVDCVGGAQSAYESSYGWAEAVGEDLEPINFFGVEFLGFGDFATAVIAHELAHLLGAHHHYANCAESIPAYNPAYTSLACTTMINAVDMATYQFSTVNQVQVRSFAEHWDL